MLPLALWPFGPTPGSSSFSEEAERENLEKEGNFKAAPINSEAKAFCRRVGGSLQEAPPGRGDKEGVFASTPPRRSPSPPVAWGLPVGGVLLAGYRPAGAPGHHDDAPIPPAEP